MCFYKTDLVKLSFVLWGQDSDKGVEYHLPSTSKNIMGYNHVACMSNTPSKGVK